MANHNEVGKLGEKYAQEFLINNDYKISECNWRWGKGEIDIIAIKNDVLVFIEVKTRSKNTFGNPEDTISEKKKNLMYELATEYMYQSAYASEFRFDVIAIVLEPYIKVDHFMDAFFPSW